jgi:hypothetical protein
MKQPSVQFALVTKQASLEFAADCEFVPVESFEFSTNRDGHRSNLNYELFGELACKSGGDFRRTTIQSDTGGWAVTGGWNLGNLIE